MEVPGRWSSHSTLIGWVAFVVLSLPTLVFFVRANLFDEFDLARVFSIAVFLVLIGLISLLLRYGLSRSSVPAIAVALLLIVFILITYAAVFSILIGGLKIEVF